jgi:long-chain acyl-CoA synthetase
MIALPHVARLFKRLAMRLDEPAVFADGKYHSYACLLAEVDRWTRRLDELAVAPGAVVSYVGDYALGTIALMLALIRRRAIAVPLTAANVHEHGVLCAIAGVEFVGHFENGDIFFKRCNVELPPPLIRSFRASAQPGLVVFTSGSSGKPKAILHSFEKLLSKFERDRPGYRTLLLLMMDHLGGINTLMACLSNGGLAVCVPERTPDAVCNVVAASRAELLPTTPTFLNMMLVSGVLDRYDLSAIRVISYGAEPMSPYTLSRLHQAFPNVHLKQTYGLSELGVLHSKSPDPSSLWLHVGGDGFEAKSVNGVLYIRSASSMVGYLNADNPFDEDGWMCTGDLVEESADGMIRFLGRVSDVINVGGQKVFPTEVEAVLAQAPNVAEAAVFGLRHPLLGQCVASRVSLIEAEAQDRLGARLRQYCLERLTKYKVPMRFEIVDLIDQATTRAKKRRADA